MLVAQQCWSCTSGGRGAGEVWWWRIVGGAGGRGGGELLVEVSWQGGGAKGGELLVAQVRWARWWRIVGVVRARNSLCVGN